MCYLCSGSQTLRPIYMLNAILVKYFGAILLLDGIVKMAPKSNYNGVIFYLCFTPKNSLY